MARRPLGTPGPSVSTPEGQNYTKFRIRWLPFSRAVDQGGAGLLLELVVRGPASPGRPWARQPDTDQGLRAQAGPGPGSRTQTRDLRAQAGPGPGSRTQTGQIRADIEGEGTCPGLHRGDKGKPGIQASWTWAPSLLGPPPVHPASPWTPPPCAPLLMGTPPPCAPLHPVHPSPGAPLHPCPLPQ